MRNQSVQSWRGVAIIAVLLIHLSFLDKKDEDVFLVSRQVLNFAVPLFFFISGYFAKYCGAVNWKGLNRLLIPYLLWTAVSYGIGEIEMILGGKDYYYDQFTLVEVLFFGYSSMQMYYLTALMGLLLVTPVIYRYSRRKWTGWFCLAATPLCILLNYVWEWCYSAPLPFLSSTFIFHLTYYYLGLMARKKDISIPIRNSSLLVVAFVALYAGIIESRCFATMVGGEAYAGPTRIFAMLFCLSVIAIAYKEMKLPTANNPRRTLLTIVGDYSFFIYLSHIQLFRGGYFVASRIVGKEIPTLEMEIVKDIVVVSVTLLLSILIGRLSERLLSERVIRWIGIR